MFNVVYSYEIEYKLISLTRNINKKKTMLLSGDTFIDFLTQLYVDRSITKMVIREKKNEKES